MFRLRSDPGQLLLYVHHPSDKTYRHVSGAEPMSIGEHEEPGADIVGVLTRQDQDRALLDGTAPDGLVASHSLRRVHGDGRLAVTRAGREAVQVASLHHAVDDIIG